MVFVKLKTISSLLYIEHELATIYKHQNCGHRITIKIKSIENILSSLSDQFIITQNTNKITQYLYEENEFYKKNLTQYVELYIAKKKSKKILSQ